MRSILSLLVICVASSGLAGCKRDDAGMRDGGLPPSDAGAGSDGGGTGDGWSATAQVHRGMNDMMFSYDCPAAGTAGSVWGTDIYSDDSSVCTAAVHAGAITLAAGGTVQIRILPGQAMYTGSERNGITSLDWTTPWEGSFSVVP